MVALFSKESYIFDAYTKKLEMILHNHISVIIIVLINIFTNI